MWTRGLRCSGTPEARQREGFATLLWRIHNPGEREAPCILGEIDAQA